VAHVRGCIALAAVLAGATAFAAETPTGAAAPAPPPVSVETTLATERDNVPQCAYDGKADTCFLSARPPKAGDTFTMVFAEPARISRARVATGTTDGKNVVAGAALEASADGKEFRQVAAFASGAARADLGGKETRALRIRATADGAAPVAIHEITLDATPPIPVFKYPLLVRLDYSEVPEMKDWCERAAHLVEQWYPRLADTLASDGYSPPRRINLTFKKGDKGIAGTSGSNITAYDGWFKAHPADVGAIIHEAIHVVQSYRSRGNPGWLVEGIADYVRFWIFEPQPPRRRLDPDRIKYTDSYQITAAFLAWVVEKRDKDLVTKLNAACRKGQYKPELWKEYTGKDLDALWEEFRQSLPKK